MEKTKALDIGKFTQICLDIEIEQDKQGNFGNALFVGELRKFISSFPAIEAVPLEPLAKWMAERYAVPCRAFDEPEKIFCGPCYDEGISNAECWKRYLTKWMEGQDATN